MLIDDEDIMLNVYVPRPQRLPMVLMLLQNFKSMISGIRMLYETASLVFDMLLLQDISNECRMLAQSG